MSAARLAAAYLLNSSLWEPVLLLLYDVTVKKQLTYLLPAVVYDSIHVGLIHSDAVYILSVFMTLSCTLR